MKHDLSTLGKHFGIDANFLSAETWGSGHINDTYLTKYQKKDRLLSFIHQRVNKEIFKQTEEMMENICRVTQHLQNTYNLDGVSGNNRDALLMVSCVSGRPFFQDADGDYWRTYHFIEGTRSYDVIESTDQAFEAAKMFGHFQADMADFPVNDLVETIPDFHNTPKRFQTFLEAVESDPIGRASTCEAEIAFLLERKDLTTKLLDLHRNGEIPLRVTHNDTKLNNVLLDQKTGQGICVIDLDTVMPGLSLYDFGDMIRTFTSPAPEDEQDLSKVTMQMSMFKALTAGYLEATQHLLTDAEKENLVFSGKLITLEVSLRFLADYLTGDTYFAIHREGQNLDRCRAQIQLIKSIEKQEAQMERMVAKLLRPSCEAPVYVQANHSSSSMATVSA